MFATQCLIDCNGIFTDHIKCNTVNKATCRTPKNLQKNAKNIRKQKHLPMRHILRFSKTPFLFFKNPFHKGINKPCTQLHPPPLSSFQPPPSSLQHSQQYSNLNIVRNWAIFPNLGRKILSCPFCLKIGAHGISRLLILIPTLVFWISNPKFLFGQIWAKKFKVVHFAWKLAHMVSQGCWFLFEH